MIKRTPLEIPPPVACSFMADAKAYYAEDNPLKDDEIAVRQVRALKEHRRPRDLKMRLVDVKKSFRIGARRRLGVNAAMVASVSAAQRNRMA
jgi:hypothetical protein